MGGDELLGGQLPRRRLDRLGQQVVAQEQRVHAGLQEALDGLLGAMHDRLAADVEAGVEHHRHAGEPARTPRSGGGTWGCAAG